MTEVLRDDLLSGLSVLVAGPGECRATLLGAGLRRFEPALDETGEGGAQWVASSGGADALVFDASRGFAGGPTGLSEVLDSAWIACAAVANGAFIPSGRGGRIVLVAPPAGAGELSGAAVAGLENLARTLSVEWARYRITTVAIAPGAGTGSDELATLLGFLLSPAGAYFSGTRLDLD